MLSIIIDELISYGGVKAARVQSTEPKKTAHGCKLTLECWSAGPAEDQVVTSIKLSDVAHVITQS